MTCWVDYWSERLVGLQKKACLTVGNKHYSIKVSINRCSEHLGIRCNPEPEDDDQTSESPMSCMVFGLSLRHGDREGFALDRGYAQITLHKVVTENTLLYLAPDSSPFEVLCVVPFGRYLQHVLSEVKSPLSDNNRGWACVTQETEQICFYCGASRVGEKNKDCHCDLSVFMRAREQGSKIKSRKFNRCCRFVTHFLYLSVLELARDGRWWPLGLNLVVGELQQPGFSICVVIDGTDYTELSDATRDILRSCEYAGTLDTVIVRHGTTHEVLSLRSIVECLHERQVLKHTVLKEMGIEYKVKKRLGPLRNANLQQYGVSGYESDYAGSGNRSRLSSSYFPLTVYYSDTDTGDDNSRASDSASESEGGGGAGGEDVKNDVNKQKEAQPESLLEICAKNCALFALTDRKFGNGGRYFLPNLLYESYVYGADLLRSYSCSDSHYRILEAMYRPVQVLENVERRAEEIYEA